jgi:hypothetical protein
MNATTRSLIGSAALVMTVAIGPTSLAAASPVTNSHADATSSASRLHATRDVNLPAVNLGSSGSFAILAKSGISTTGTTSITGDIGVSPISSTAITGFGLKPDSSNQFSISSLVSGHVYAADYAPPTPTKMTTAVGDMQVAYTDAAGRTNPTATELGAGNIDGKTLAPGLYKWSSGVTIPTGVTLSGGPNDVWIFQIAGTLTVGSGAIVHLNGGAQASNIFWQVAGQSTLGSTSNVSGNILDKTAIVMDNGATLNGRALAQTAVTLIANDVTEPTPAIPLVITGKGTQPAHTNIAKFSWTVVTGTQPTAFNIIALSDHGKRLRINHSLIKLHAKRTYTYNADVVKMDIEHWFIDARVGNTFIEFGPLEFRG